MSALAQFRKLYSQFQPFTINEGKNIPVYQQKHFTDDQVVLNPASFLVFEEISENLQAELPIDYKPQISDANPLVLCSVCGQVPIVPQSRICGCVLCEKCDEQKLNDAFCQVHQQSYGGHQECVPADYMMHFNELVIDCPFETLGCPESIKLCSLRAHLQACMYAILRCPYCLAPFQRQGLKEHQQTCSKVPCKCVLCGNQSSPQFIKKHLDEHHPICQYCGARQKVPNEKAHEPKRCPFDNCIQLVSDCALQEHLRNIEFREVHFEQIVDRLYTVETSISKLECDKNALVEQYKQEYIDCREIVKLQQELRHQNIIKQRYQLFNQRYNNEEITLEQANTVLSLSERIQILYFILKQIVSGSVNSMQQSHQSQFQAKSNNIILPTQLKFVQIRENDPSFLEIQVQIVGQQGAQHLLAYYQESVIEGLNLQDTLRLPFINQQPLITQLISYSLIIQQLLIQQKKDRLSALELETFKIFEQTAHLIIDKVQYVLNTNAKLQTKQQGQQYISELSQFGHNLQLLFQIMFKQYFPAMQQDFIDISQFQLDLDSENEQKLAYLRYFTGDAVASDVIGVGNMNIINIIGDINILQFVHAFDMPIVKYFKFLEETQQDDHYGQYSQGQYDRLGSANQLYNHYSTAPVPTKQQSQMQEIYNQFDIVIGSPRVCPNILPLKAFQLLTHQLAPEETITCLIQQVNAFSLMAHHVLPRSIKQLEVQISQNKLFDLETLVLEQQSELVQLKIVNQNYDTLSTLNSDHLFRVIANIATLRELTLQNLRIAEGTMKHFTKIRQLDTLRITDCQVQYPSHIVPGGGMSRIVLSLKSNSVFQKIMEQNLTIFFGQKLPAANNLVELSLQLNNEFPLARAAVEQLEGNPYFVGRLRILRLHKCGLRNESFQVLAAGLGRFEALEELSLSQNPLFQISQVNVELVLQTCQKFAEQLNQLLNLTRLELADTRLNGRCLEALVNGLASQGGALGGFHQLTGLQMLGYLDLAKGRLSDVDMKLLAKLLIRLPNAQGINLAQCQEVTERGLQIIKGRVGRGFKIGFDGSPETQQKLLQLGMTWYEGVYVVE